MKYIILMIVLVSSGIMFSPQKVQALSCVPITTESDFNQSKAVFTGTVTSVSENGANSTMKVTRSWKGPKVDDTVNAISSDPVTWGVKFKTGYKYLVFSKTDQPYTLGLCDSSREIITDLHIQNAQNQQEKDFYTTAVEQDKVWLQELSAKLDLMTQPGYENSHPVGTNVLGTDGTVYRITEGGYRSPYTSAGAFLSYKFNTWASVVPANSADMAMSLSTHFPCAMQTPVTYYIPPRNGSLINDHGTVYLISNGERAGFASAQAFTELGYKFSNVYPGDTSFMCINAEPINTSDRRHSNGALINDNGTLYVMRDGYRFGFPSMTVLDSWGYWVSEAVPANSYDRAAEIGGVMSARTASQLGF